MHKNPDPTDNIPQTITELFIESARVMALTSERTRPLKDGEYFIKTLYSGISAGTELTFFLGTNPKSAEGWDAERHVFRGDMEPDLNDVFPKHDGYMEVGEVIASRNADFPVGLKVAGLYHHHSGYIADKNSFCIALPDDFDTILGIWVAKMGPISMNGILYAADEVQRQPIDHIEGSLAGQRIVVLGAGVIGLLCGVFAKWAGAREVVIVDTIAERLAAAAKLGLQPMAAGPQLPIAIKDRWPAEPGNSGADLVLQCTGSDYLLNQAFGCLRDQGTVIDLGFYQQGANQLLLGKEFHHNRLRHICAQIGGMPRAQADKWDRRRLSQETIMFLQQHGQTLKETMITHIVPFEQAQDMFDRLAARDNSLIQVVLQPEDTAGKPGAKGGSDNHA